MSTNFTGQRGPITVSDDIEKKIEEVNVYLNTARADGKKFEERKILLETEVAELEAKKDSLSRDASTLHEQLSTTKKNKELQDVDIRSGREILSTLHQNISLAKKEYDETVEKTKAIFFEIDEAKKEISTERSALRAYASALDEKERKLDAYNEKIKRMIDAMKTN